MIPKSGYRFSEKIMLQEEDIEREDDPRIVITLKRRGGNK